MGIQPNIYRTVTCGELRETDVGREVRVAGWIESVRDHGGVLFLDLRDHYGLVQVVVRDSSVLEGIHRETVISVGGNAVLRSVDTVNPKIPTGSVEIVMKDMEVLGRAQAVLPFEVQTSQETREEVRLKYRYIDLRNHKIHDNIVLRSTIIARLRERMTGLGFLDIQTPILTCSSPEGARDYLVPSRKHPGKFYSLPQAPQIFKQLLMVSGFDRYFQIAPCFRDEDARADRSPGEFYQLDFEMAFATQDDVFTVAETVLYETFMEFADKKVYAPPFPRIPYAEAMLKYGSDKPDLRNPIEIIDLTDLFAETDFGPFKGKIVRGITIDGLAKQPNSFFDKMGKYAAEAGLKGLGYLKNGSEGVLAGPIAKYMPQERKDELVKRVGLKQDGVVFFIADKKDEVDRLAGAVRAELGERLDLIEKDAFKMCFVVDFPMYETNEETGKTDFTHNPFSMPQGGLKALTEKDPLEILAYQYDIVCNGVELSSGAVRNHDPEIMLKAFEIAGYTEHEIVTQFGALYNAFKYGAPPHAGMAPGIDRMVMLLTGEHNIREVIAFPMNSNAQDVMLGAPSEVSEKQLREAHIKVR